MTVGGETSREPYDFVPLRALPLWLRWDTLPFALVYAGLIAVDTSPELGTLLARSAVNIAFFATFGVHVAVFLAQQWSVGVRAFVGYRLCRVSLPPERQSGPPCPKDMARMSSTLMRAWTHCLVIPKRVSASSSGATGAAVQANGAEGEEIVPVTLRTSDASADLSVACLRYREVSFRCACAFPTTDAASCDVEMRRIWKPAANVSDAEENGTEASLPSSQGPLFHRLRFPVDLPMSFYRAWSGHASSTDLERIKEVFSDNTVRIDLPPFFSLLAEQLVAPFFLFQLFCVLLWSLDEYWYYAIFTLFTLVLFECTVCYNRLKSLQRLRETLRVPHLVWAYRFGEWNMLRTDRLVAGDIISLTVDDASAVNGEPPQNRHEHKAPNQVPADVLLLSGSAVVNEAMLTGESVPQLKESIQANSSLQAGATVSSSSKSLDAAPTLDIDDPHHKRSILFRGTVMVNHDGTTTSGAACENVIPSPPDSGCTAVVLRTAFETTQGSLLRRMVHSSGGNTANSSADASFDSYVFLFLLLLCALLSSAFVIHYGWDDPVRNRFRLVLHVIIIVTSVVPPELPMELSLAVTTSLADLIKRCAVFCTEPFRIPLAGIVDTCAFDKTGTLTSDQMVLRGVWIPNDETEGSKEGESSAELLLPWIGEDAELGEEGYNIGSDQRRRIPQDVTRVMVGCQSLALHSRRLSSGQSGKTTGTRLPRDKYEDIIGDPLELAILKSSGWTLKSNNVVNPPSQGEGQEDKPIFVLHRFSFLSQLKRMTVLASDGPQSSNLWALTKGAPEALEPLFVPASVPSVFQATYRKYMKMGYRVLAMGYRRLANSPGTVQAAMAKVKSAGGRDFVERDLNFAGFLILDCPLKHDTTRIIAELRSSGYRSIMVTGDAILTAAEVARQIGIIDEGVPRGRVYELQERKQQEGSAFVFAPLDAEGVLDDDNCIPCDPRDTAELEARVKSAKASLCTTGTVLSNLSAAAAASAGAKFSSNAAPEAGSGDTIAAKAALKSVVPLISVFARHSPREKEEVISALNRSGNITLMCGDGTNDVGALKAAHVGVSIVSVPELESKQRRAKAAVDRVRKLEMKERKAEKKKLKKQKGVASDTNKKKALSRERARSIQESLRTMAEAEDELGFVALGDASVASPFTARTMSIRCTKDILQRGRCTLVTMLQIYKILGVNCLVNAFVLTRLHMVGVKQGDRQLTVVGIVVAMLFLFVTKGAPLPDLSPIRPPSSVLSYQAFLSILAQVSVHFFCILIVTDMSVQSVDSYDPSLVPDGPFNPNVLNTATFLVTVLATVNTFVVNYRGRPFMQSLSENLWMLRSVQICYGTLAICVLEVFPPLNQLMQLTDLSTVAPQKEPMLSDDEGAFVLFRLWMDGIHSLLSFLGMKMGIVVIMIFDTMVVLASEAFLLRYFASEVKRVH